MTLERSEAQPVTVGLMLAVFVIGVFAFLEVYAIQAILPILMHDFNAGPAEIGFTVGATVLAVAIMSPFMGMLSDAIGRKKVIVASLLFLAFPTAMLGFSSTLGQMNVWRFLQGLAVPGITVVLIAYIGEEFSGKTMTRLMTLYVSGTVLGGFSGRFILGHLTDYMTWQQAFWVMAAMASFMAARSRSNSRCRSPMARMDSAQSFLLCGTAAMVLLLIRVAMVAPFEVVGEGVSSGSPRSGNCESPGRQGAARGREVGRRWSCRFHERCSWRRKWVWWIYRWPGCFAGCWWQ